MGGYNTISTGQNRPSCRNFLRSTFRRQKEVSVALSIKLEGTQQDHLAPPHLWKDHLVQPHLWQEIPPEHIKLTPERSPWQFFRAQTVSDRRVENYSASVDLNAGSWSFIWSGRVIVTLCHISLFHDRSALLAFTSSGIFSLVRKLVNAEKSRKPDFQEVRAAKEVTLQFNIQ